MFRYRGSIASIEDDAEFVTTKNESENQIQENGRLDFSVYDLPVSNSCNSLVEQITSDPFKDFTDDLQQMRVDKKPSSSQFGKLMKKSFHQSLLQLPQQGKVFRSSKSADYESHKMKSKKVLMKQNSDASDHSRASKTPNFSLSKRFSKSLIGKKFTNVDDSVFEGEKTPTLSLRRKLSMNFASRKSPTENNTESDNQKTPRSLSSGFVSQKVIEYEDSRNDSSKTPNNMPLRKWTSGSLTEPEQGEQTECEELGSVNMSYANPDSDSGTEKDNVSDHTTNGMEWNRISRSSVYSEAATPADTPQKPPAGNSSPQLPPADEKNKLTYKESIKVRKQTYKIQKKKANKEFSTAIKDKSVIILSSWLKIRGSLKSWAKYWCVVKPEVLMIYKSDSLHHWIGTVLINNCEFIERPSSKEGFCFKILQPYGQSIWTTRGPKGEMAGALVQPMPKDYLILRALNEEIGRCWLDALEVAQRSSLVTPSDKIQSDIYGSGGESKPDTEDGRVYHDGSTGDKSDFSSADDGNDEDEEFNNTSVVDEHIEETSYNTPVETEEFGEAGEATEEIEEENKSILWSLLKQVRPGMDLSKVTLPTFILEPRSFLEKLADFYYHADILAGAAAQDDPYSRMKEVVKWYLSGFYKKPKGLKKPYNPIIGEMFRCMWPNTANNSKTFYISEQVSHHPPVSAFYVSNRKDGYVIGGSILAKSKFYGNSTSAILDGTATLTLLKLGEDYTVTMPYAHVKGILIGSLTAEMGGIINIKCEKTGYNAEIDFKLKPFWKKSGECNYVSGKIRMGNDVLSKVEGRWDGDIFITEYNKKNGSTEEPLPEMFFTPSNEMKRARLRRYNVDYEGQEAYESEKLWMLVSEAIADANQTNATREKLVLEDEQRAVHRDLEEKNEEWQPRYFELDPNSVNPHSWVYKYKDMRPWDHFTDVLQYEFKGVIKTQTKHRVPMVKQTSSSGNVSGIILSPHEPKRGERLPSIKEPLDSDTASRRTSFDRSSRGSDHSDYNGNSGQQDISEVIEKCIQPLCDQEKETQKQITLLRLELRKFAENINNTKLFSIRDLFLIAFVLILQLIINWFTKPLS